MPCTLPGSGAEPRGQPRSLTHSGQGNSTVTSILPSCPQLGDDGDLRALQQVLDTGYFGIEKVTSSQAPPLYSIPSFGTSGLLDASAHKPSAFDCSADSAEAPPSNDAPDNPCKGGECLPGRRSGASHCSYASPASGQANADISEHGHDSLWQRMDPLRARTTSPFPIVAGTVTPPLLRALTASEPCNAFSPPRSSSDEMQYAGGHSGFQQLVPPQLAHFQSAPDGANPWFDEMSPERDAGALVNGGTAHGSAPPNSLPYTPLPLSRASAPSPTLMQAQLSGEAGAAALRPPLARTSYDGHAAHRSHGSRHSNRLAAVTAPRSASVRKLSTPRGSSKAATPPPPVQGVRATNRSATSNKARPVHNLADAIRAKMASQDLPHLDTAQSSRSHAASLRAEGKPAAQPPQDTRMNCASSVLMPRDGSTALAEKSEAAVDLCSFVRPKSALAAPPLRVHSGEASITLPQSFAVPPPCCSSPDLEDEAMAFFDEHFGTGIDDDTISNDFCTATATAGAASAGACSLSLLSGSAVGGSGNSGTDSRREALQEMRSWLALEYRSMGLARPLTGADSQVCPSTDLCMYSRLHVRKL